MPIFLRDEIGRDEAGFTLAEMLLVVAITALAAGLVVGRGLPGQHRIDHAALQSFVRTLRAEAMRTDRRLALGVGGDGHSFEAGALGLALGPDRQAFASGPKGADVILFDPDGSSPGGLLRVVGKGFTDQVVIAPVTGTVQP
ncbi:MAG: prepilin-type N-terminal cleavage/methylation domain-containing protein [Pseudomonadota bacterium]